MKIEDIVDQHEEDQTNLQDQLAEHQGLIHFFANLGCISCQAVDNDPSNAIREEVRPNDPPMVTLNVFPPPHMEP